MRTRSLRTRLVALTLLLLAVASILVGLVTTVSVRTFLVGRLDEELGRTVRFVTDQGRPDDLGVPPVDEPGTQPGHQGPPDDMLQATIIGGTVQSGRVVHRFSTTTAVPVSDFPAIAAVTAGTRPTTVALGDLGAFRALAVTTSTGTAVVGLSEKQVGDTVTFLITTEVIVAIVTLGVAGVIGAIVVRRELKPLERVAATARRVATLPLDRGEVDIAERVPDADPTTEVGQVGTALNRMLDHVGASLQARQDSETQLRQFVADASHELRTPLAAIRGYAELTRRGRLSDETAYSLGRISSQAERMTTLVEDLLLLARLDAGRPLERGEVDLTRLVLDAVSDAHAAGAGHRWRMELPDDPVTVTGDGSRLTQVLTNLLANARTHTPPGTDVTVTLATDGDAALVTVHDAGPGIPPELVGHVFERFARGSSSRSRENGSTGLGLAIVDAVVAAHGGTVGVTSTPGSTAFTVRLPRTPAPIPALTG